MLDKFLRYGGFGYFGLVFILIVLSTGMTTNGLGITSFFQLSRNLLYIILAFGIGIAFYMENKTLVLVLLIINTIISLLVSISNIMMILRIYPSLLTFTNWMTIFLPLFMSILTLVGFFLIQQKVGMFLIIIVQSLSAFYFLFVLYMIDFVNYSSYEILMINAYNRVVGIYSSVLILCFVIKYFYKPSIKQSKKIDSQEISFD